jgi:hypothetical protein
LEEEDGESSLEEDGEAFVGGEDVRRELFAGWVGAGVGGCVDFCDCECHIKVAADELEHTHRTTTRTMKIFFLESNRLSISI